MLYGIATLNKYTENGRRKDKIIWKVNWNIQRGVGEKLLTFKTRDEAVSYGEGQVWEYKVLELTDEAELTKSLEDFPANKPSTDM